MVIVVGFLILIVSNVQANRIVYRFLSEIRYRRELEDLHLRPKHAADIHRWCAQIRHDSHASHVGRPSRRPVSRVVEHGTRQSGVNISCVKKY